MCCISGHKLKNRVTQGWYSIEILLELYLGHQFIHLVAQRDQWEEMSMRPCRKRSSEVTSNTLEWVELLTLPLTQRAREREEERMERKRESNGEEVKIPVSCGVSMNAEATRLSMELYMGLKNKKKKVCQLAFSTVIIFLKVYLFCRESAQTRFSKK